METVMLITLSAVFWTAFGLLALSYVVYPILLSLFARGRTLPPERFEADHEFPEVAVLMAVYNEEAVLEETLRSIVASDYPAGKVRVWIGSDGSTDRSHEIVKSFQASHAGIQLTIFPGRNGKIRIINQLAAEALAAFSNPDTAAFVLCDANVCWSPPALRRMVRHFKRDEVGLVGSSVMDRQSDHAGIGDEEEAYVGRENRTKFFEGVLWGNMMGAFGACYALRARLFHPVPEHFIVDDFFQTMACLEGESAAIVDLEAEVFEAVSVDIEEEFRRKRRIAIGNFQNLSHFRSFLLPWNGGLATFFAFWSHKGIRWIGPVLLVVMAGCLIPLVLLHPIYLVPLTLFLVSLLISVLDSLFSRLPWAPHVRIFRFIRYFYAMNYAIFRGFVDYCSGSRNSVWEPTKRLTKTVAINQTGAYSDS